LLLRTTLTAMCIDVHESAAEQCDGAPHAFASARLSESRLSCRFGFRASSEIGGTVTAGFELVLGCAGARC